MNRKDPTDVQRLLANNIKHIRAGLGLTQMQLAEYCGVSTSFIGEIEICRKFPSAHTLQKIATALGVRPADLFFEEKEDSEVDEQSKKELSVELMTVIDLRRKLIKDMDLAILDLKRKHSHN